MVAVLFLLLSGAAAGAGELRIIVDNVRSATGSVVVWVYDDAERWLGDDIFRTLSLPVQGNRADDKVTLQINLPSGEYALSVFHDVDGNGRMARNFIGLPKEPAGLSNNAVPRFGPPKWQDAKFIVDSAPIEQAIRLN